MIPALAFLRPHLVEEAFDQLVEHADFPVEALPIANYFEDNYIGRRQRNRRQPASFPIELWNVYDRTMNNQQRTNNDVEGETFTHCFYSVKIYLFVTFFAHKI